MQACASGDSAGGSRVACRRRRAGSRHRSRAACERGTRRLSTAQHRLARRRLAAALVCALVPYWMKRANTGPRHHSPRRESNGEFRSTAGIERTLKNRYAQPAPPPPVLPPRHPAHDQGERRVDHQPLVLSRSDRLGETGVRRGQKRDSGKWPRVLLAPIIETRQYWCVIKTFADRDTQRLLEALKGDRKGQHSVRINQQWRLCFRWQDGNAFDVEIVDYH